MKILVVDDSPLHQEAARQTLSDHELTVVGGADEARDVLVGSEVEHGKFEAVLTDLLMPAGTMSQSPDSQARFSGQEMPAGLAIAFLAVLKGARYVGVVTDVSHHDHPASAWLDDLIHWHFSLGVGATPTTKWVIGQPEVIGVRLEFFQKNRKISVPVAGFTCQKCQGSQPECWNCDGTGLQSGKDWGKVLAKLQE